MAATQEWVAGLVLDVTVVCKGGTVDQSKPSQSSSEGC